jgi:glycosyltransferase involved in cell wall biosynthesis
VRSSVLHQVRCLSDIAVIVSTYNKPEYLRRCLLALDRQSHRSFEIVVADDGSTDETRQAIATFAQVSRHAVKHVWHEDRGFRKTAILNKAILASETEYLVFIDGDCVAHRDFIHEHATNARPGHYLNGSLIRLRQPLSEHITQSTIIGGEAFETGWLTRHGGRFDRRFLRLSLPYGLRCWLNRASRTRLYWLGSNASCYREDALAVNGFDNRFSYGFEDGDFGNRLTLHGVAPKTVRWTAVLLHLWHERPWSDPDIQAANRDLMDENLALARPRTRHGLSELAVDP